jgi:hypothetical protein
MRRNSFHILINSVTETSDVTDVGFLRGVIILLSERGILIHNDPFQNRQQTKGGVFLSHPHKSTLND